MNFFEQILAFLDGQMTRPTMYGWFHLMMFAIIIALTIFLVAKYKNATDKQNRNILLIFAVVMIVFEIYKQLNFSYNSATDVWNYQWYAFPFQFCSTPMYVFLIAALIKKGKVQDAMFAFLATYGLFGGLAVMLYPNDVFVSTIGINIQTMVHHGLMLTGGIYLLASGRVKLHIRSLLKASIVFVIILVLAQAMNYAAHFAQLPGTFNMFFISPYYGNHLPILSNIRATAPYPLFLVVYVVGFTFVAGLMLLIAMALKTVKAVIIKNCKKRKAC